MKKMISVLLIGFAMIAYSNPANAQIRIGVHINIGDQPEWGPSGYDYAEYYYMPEIETYYYVPRRQFVYMSNGQWIFSANLPVRYSSYDLYRGYKVVLNQHNAYRGFNDHRVRYARYSNYYNRQPALKARHDNGNHNGWNKDNGRGRDDRGRGRGNGRGHGRGHDD